MLIGLFGRSSQPRAILWASIAGGVGVFTLISKNQVFYTLPLLAPLAAMAASKPRLAMLGLLGGLWSFGSVGLGLLPGGPWMNEAWVRPRHTGTPAAAARCGSRACPECPRRHRWGIT